LLVTVLCSDAIGFNLFFCYSLGFWRYFIASLTLLGVAVVIKMKMPAKRDWLIFFLSGVFLFNCGERLKGLIKPSN